LQHQSNPVNWQPWSDAAFEQARAEGKPVLLSIGYSSCHWCHVMAHESFEDEATAALMNESFVNIKVDREERPDVDQIYQQALALMGKQGGWPLTIFLTPDREPFWGGTYFPPEARHGMASFRDVLQGVARSYVEESDRSRTTCGAFPPRLPFCSARKRALQSRLRSSPASPIISLALSIP
jgi:uncharacterized protein YyaL (SSP411 family)